MAKKSDKQEWYSNQQLFEIFQTSVKELTEEMNNTKDRLHKYNGLHDRFDTVEEKLSDVDRRLEAQVTRCNKVQASVAGKSDLIDKVIRISPILIAAVMGAFTIWISMR